jgi:hypothetical protein
MATTIITLRSPSPTLSAFVAIYDALAPLEPEERRRAIDAALVLLDGHPVDDARVVNIVNSMTD